jgi:hypothetical protein
MTMSSLFAINSLACVCAARKKVSSAAPIRRHVRDKFVELLRSPLPAGNTSVSSGIYPRPGAILISSCWR